MIRLLVPSDWSAIPPPPNAGLIAEPVWNTIWPPLCADAATLQLPLMLDPLLKMMVPKVSARPPTLPPLVGLMVTLFVLISAFELT